jgi:hypothetical protein
MHCKGAHISAKLDLKFSRCKRGTKLTKADGFAVCQGIIEQVFDYSGMVFHCVECGVVIDPHEVQRPLHQTGLFRREPRQPFSDPRSHRHRVIAEEEGIGKPFYTT